MRPSHPLALALVAVLAVLLASTPGTLAGFTDQATTTSPEALATSGAIALPATPTATEVSATGQVELTWPETAVGGTVASEYVVLAYDAATGGSAEVACPRQATTSCSVPRPPVGTTRHYAVRALFATHWQREGDRRPFTPAPTAPPAAPTLTRPVAGQTYTTAAIRTAVAPCGGLACGTTEASTTVTYVMRRTRNGILGGQTACWDGSAWDADCTTRRAARVAGTTWTVPGVPTSGYTDPSGLSSRWEYELTVRVEGPGGSTTTVFRFASTR